MTEDTEYDDREIKRCVVDRIREIELPRGDPVATEFVSAVTVEDGLVTITVEFVALDLELAERLAEQLRGAALATAGVSHVRLESTTADAPETGVPITGVDTVIAVGSAKGGVGKTTITATLAQALDERGLDVAVFDANVHAPDVPDLLEAEGPIHQTPRGQPVPIDADGIQVVSIELIAEDGPVTWRGAMVHDVMTDLLGNATWDERDVLLVDLPPGVGDAVYTIVQQAPVDGSILVTTPTDASIRATNRSRSVFAASDVALIAVVSNMAGVEDGAGPPPFDHDREGPEALLEGLESTQLIEVPFDRALQRPESLSILEPRSTAERAIDALADGVTAFHETRHRPEIPADAVDLRGLPPSTIEQQAMTELGAAPTEEVVLVTRTEPAGVLEVLTDALAHEGHELPEATVEDLDRHGWLVTLTRVDATIDPAPS